jgi:hypothetical protein
MQTLTIDPEFKNLIPPLSEDERAGLVSGGHADISRLKNKIKSNAPLLKKQASMQAYMELFDDLYNRMAHGKKTPLAFLTNETIRERNLFPAKSA